MNDIEKVMSLSSGLTRELFEFIRSITRNVPEFAAGTTMATMAAACQGSYEWPTGELVSDYFLLVGGASVTKSSFIEIPDRLLTEATPNQLLPPKDRDRGVVCPTADMAEQLHERFVDSPNRVILGDEMGKMLEGAYLLSDPKQRAKRDFLLKHYNGVAIKPHPMRTEGKSLPGVAKPCVTVLGALVTHQWDEMLQKGEVVYDGFASRFCVFPTKVKLPLRRKGKPKWESPKEIVAKLRLLIEDSVYFVVDDPEKTDYFAPKRVMKDHPSREQAFQQFVDELEAEQVRFDADFETLVTPIRDRIMSRIDKFSFVHAAGCGRKELAEEDSAFALALCRWLWIEAVEMLRSEKSHFDKVCDAVLDFIDKDGLAGQAYSASKIFDHGSRNILRTAKKKLGPRAPEDVLGWLVRNGKLLEVTREPEGKKHGGNRRCHVQYVRNLNAQEGVTRQECEAQTNAILEDIRQNEKETYTQRRPRLGFLERKVASRGE